MQASRREWIGSSEMILGRCWDAVKEEKDGKGKVREEADSYSGGGKG